MRDRSGQFTEHRDLRHVREFRGGARKRLLSDLRFRDVHQFPDVIESRGGICTPRTLYSINFSA